jgi:hypothetical protein
MKLGIMQPYFLPYVGYYQLIAAVDLFIVYDNIKYTKKGWINRNRFLLNGCDATFSIPLKKDTDDLTVMERMISADFQPDKLLNQFRGAYQRAPYYRQVFPLLEDILHQPNVNLFDFILHAIRRTCDHLHITTDIRISSAMPIDHNLKGQEKVLALCKAAGASTYINAIGGRELYAREDFHTHNIDLKFIQSHPLTYQQFHSTFVPWLSIIDVLMFNQQNTITQYIRGNYDLL